MQPVSEKSCVSSDCSSIFFPHLDFDFNNAFAHVTLIVLALLKHTKLHTDYKTLWTMNARLPFEL